MNDQQQTVIDNIPVLSEVVIPGSARTAGEPEPASASAALDASQAERLQAQADMLLADMRQRIECMVDEELARAHSSALETARGALQQRLLTEMEARLNAFIATALTTREA